LFGPDISGVPAVVRILLFKAPLKVGEAESVKFHSQISQVEVEALQGQALQLIVDFKWFKLRYIRWIYALLAMGYVITILLTQGQAIPLIPWFGLQFILVLIRIFSGAKLAYLWFSSPFGAILDIPRTLLQAWFLYQFYTIGAEQTFITGISGFAILNLVHALRIFENCRFYL
jgi:hypothetical protein